MEYAVCRGQQAVSSGQNTVRGSEPRTVNREPWKFVCPLSADRNTNDCEAGSIVRGTDAVLCV